jgi:hypothetical protein
VDWLIVVLASTLPFLLGQPIRRVRDARPHAENRMNSAITHQDLRSENTILAIGV